MLWSSPRCDRLVTTMLSNCLFQMARSDLVGPIVRWGFGHLTWLFPVKRVATTPTVIAFYHPRPTWETHILLVPKVGIPSLLAVDHTQEPIILEILLLAHRLGRGLEGMNRSYVPLSLIVNGGAYQDVAQVHFHLAAGPSVQRYWCPHDMSAKPLLKTDDIWAFHHPSPVRTTHIVLRSTSTSAHNASAATAIIEAQVHALIAMTRDLVRQYDLFDNGFSLIAGAVDGDLDYSCFHLVSGALTRQ